MRAARVLITARSTAWARTAAQAMTGFATSVIGCKVEAGIEAELLPDETLDGRPGVSVLVFGFDADGLGGRLVDRVGQTVLTCPTTACFDGLPEAAERVKVGGSLRHFGDRFQSSKFLDGRRYWRIPVMEGEFLVQEAFGVQKAIGGGNFLILAADEDTALAAAESAVDAMRKVRGVILPFPGGIVRAGSKVGAKTLQEDDRVHQRRVLSDAARTNRRDERAAGRREFRAGDRGGRPGPSRYRERPARRHRRRLPSRGRRDLGGELRRQAREAPLPAPRAHG